MLKAASGLVLFLACVLVALPAQAQTLVTGAIRDQSGSAVGGARVTATDQSGHIVGTDVAIDDGTFALDVPVGATTVTIACDYCRSVTRPLDATGEPLVVIVQRFTAVTQLGPSTADIRALPYRSAADIASLRPFTVVDAGRISDRGLDVYAAALVNGLPFYSPADGDNYIRLVPAQTVAALVVSSPLAAPVYGGYAGAGVYDLRLQAPDVSTSRLDGGNGFDVVARSQTANVGALYGRSNGDGDRREVAATDVTLPFAGGRLSLGALDMADQTAAASGAGIGYTTSSRRYSTSASLRATQTGDASLVTFHALVRNHGPLALEFGFRAARATSANGGIGSAQADAALYAAATRTSGTDTLSANLAVDRGSDCCAGSARAGAVVGSFANDVRLAAHWTLHTGVVSNVRIPTFAQTAAAARGESAGDRSLLFEQSVTYADLRRIRITGLGYTQRTTSASTSHVHGIGIDTSWQIAPQLALRTWLLRANQSAIPEIFSGSTNYAATLRANPLTRRVTWLTYDNIVRIDLLLRGGALEGDVRIPLGATYALALGTSTDNGFRATTLGLTLR